MRQIKIDIRPHTVQEEFDYLSYTLEKKPFFKINNYTVELPDHPVFQNLTDFSGVNKNNLFNIFKKEIYDPDFFKPGITTLESYRPIFNKAISRFTDMNKKWGFKTFPKYSVLLTRYGPGGSYNTHNGKVIIMTDIDGAFRKFHPEESIIHEIIHIGIEENIVNHFGLDHWEKEELVDLICVLKFGDILPDYLAQIQGNRKFDGYVTLTSIDNLPKAIEKYVTDFPR